MASIIPREGKYKAKDKSLVVIERVSLGGHAFGYHRGQAFLWDCKTGKVFAPNLPSYNLAHIVGPWYSPPPMPRQGDVWINDETKAVSRYHGDEWILLGFLFT
jgi:hypothetical protein